MKIKFAILIFAIFTLFLLSLIIGSVSIPIREVATTLAGGEPQKESWKYIILYARLPQAVTALFCGASLATSGLMLQTTFSNPLAGPSILGISSGASLGVALVMLLFGGSLSLGNLTLNGFMAISFAAIAGSLLTMALIIILSSFIKSNIMMLIIGIMIGYISSSAVSLLNFLSTAEGVQSYVIWGLGDFSGVSSANIPIFTISLSLALLLALLQRKNLNTFLLGEKYAENLGLNIKLTRCTLLLTIGILTAITTAFCGPISFIGLAVPHIARLLFKTSNHNSLLPATLLCGAFIALLCNIVCSIPNPHGLIPINAITPLIGAPVIIYIIINQNKIKHFN